MVKLKENKNLAQLCGVGVRRFIQLKLEYKKTGEILILKKMRIPKTLFFQEEIAFMFFEKKTQTV